MCHDIDKNRTPTNKYTKAFIIRKNDKEYSIKVIGQSKFTL